MFKFKNYPKLHGLIQVKGKCIVMEQHPNSTAQLQLIEAIQAILAPNLALVEVMSQLLGISIDSAYRRIRGETALSVDEAAVLCKKFKISFDSFVNPDMPMASFRYNPMVDEAGFMQHLTSIRDDMQLITKATDPQIVWAAIDIPIFHHFNYPDLSAFKMFYWLTAVVNDPHLTGKQFDAGLISDELKQIGTEIYDLYLQIPSVEIWSDATINSLIKQIEFYWDSGIFTSKKQALTIVEQSIQEFQTLKKQAEKSSKKPEDDSDEANDFKMYCSDIEIGNNCIQVTIGNTNNVYITFNTFNALVTGNDKFCKSSKIWIDNLMGKATLISGVSEKIRNQFFSGINTKLDRLGNKIEND